MSLTRHDSVRDGRRADSAAKVTGSARYTSDVELPGMLHARVLRSPHAHARVLSIDARRAREHRRVVAVATRDDLESLDATYGFTIKDQPVVATDKVRYAGDVVAAVAAIDERAALEATRLIEVEYEPLPAVMTIHEALAPEAPALFDTTQPGASPQYGEGTSGEKEPSKNVCYRFDYTAGDSRIFDSCDLVFEDTFSYTSSQHFHLEPFVAVARMDGESIEVWSSTQSPFPVRQELARIFRLPENAVRVHVPFVGGGFGAKNNCKAEPIAVLLARLTGRPVRYCLTAAEGFLTQRQHNARIHLRTGVTNDGTLVARESHVYLDGGAYSDASPLVAEKAGYRVAGPYGWDHIESHAYCVMTNTTPAGPFRGFGGVQASWACESQIDMIARRLGMDPYELRARNLLRPGEPYVPGESGTDSNLLAGLDEVADRLGYHPRRSRERGRGMGLSVGFKDGGGINKPAQARLTVTTSGRAVLGCGTIEIGQGAATALSEIAAEVLGIPREWVRYATVDTDATPFDPGTYASSGISVMGQAVERAARDVRDQALSFAAERLDREPEELSLEDWKVRAGGEEYSMSSLIVAHFGAAGFEFVGDGFFKVAKNAGAPLGSQSVFWEVGWGGAEVEVDEETGALTILKLVVGSDAGHAVDLDLCKGQVEGAAVMGLGQALFERLVYDNEKLLSHDPLHYRVPLAADVPDTLETFILEQNLGPGPGGSKGLAEIGTLVVGPAIANAVEDAVGARVRGLPLSPENVLAAISSATNTGVTASTGP